MTDRQRAVNARIVGKQGVGPGDFLKCRDQVVVEQDFSDRSLIGFDAYRCRFERCKFERMRVEDASFGSGGIASTYVECSFDGSHLRAPTPGNARFERCTFDNVRLQQWRAFAVEFVDCVFSGRADECMFNGTVPERRRAKAGRAVNEFRGNDFAAMKLHDVAFRTGIDLTRQTLPGGADYVFLRDARGAVARTRIAVGQWDDEAQRVDALAILRRIEKQSQDGQDQLLLPMPGRGDRTRASVFALLGEA